MLVALAIVLVVIRVPEIAVLLGLGVVALIVRLGPWSGVGPATRRGVAGVIAGSGRFEPWPRRGRQGSWPVGVAAIAVVTATPALIFLEFAKIGAVLFGSGYVLVALLRSSW